MTFREIRAFSPRKIETMRQPVIFMCDEWNRNKNGKLCFDENAREVWPPFRSLWHQIKILSVDKSQLHVKWFAWQ